MTVSSTRGKRPPGIGIGRRACAFACTIALACGLVPTAAFGDGADPATDESQAAPQIEPVAAAQPTAGPAAAPAASTFAITTAELPTAAPGAAYTASVETTGAPASVTWKLEAPSGETLPAWLSIAPNGAKAALSGTPTIADIGLSRVVVTATDASDPANKAAKELTVNVFAKPALNVSGTANVDWTFVPETPASVGTLVLKSSGLTLSGKAADDLKIGFAAGVEIVQFQNVAANGFDLSVEADMTADPARTLLFEGDNTLTAIYASDDGTPIAVNLGGQPSSADSVTLLDGALVSDDLAIYDLRVVTERSMEAGGALNVIAGNVVARQALVAGDALAVTDDSFVKTQRLEAGGELSLSESALAIEPPDAGRVAGLPDGIAAGSNLYVHDSIVTVQAAGDMTAAGFPVPAAVYAGGHATFSGSTLVSVQCTAGTAGAWGIFAGQGLHFDLAKEASVDATGRAGGGKANTFGMGTNGTFEFAKNNAVAEPVGGAPMTIAGNATAVGSAGAAALHAAVAYLEPAAPKPDPKEEPKLVPTDGGKLAKTGDPAAPLSAAVAAAAALGGAAAAFALLRRRATKR